MAIQLACFVWLVERFFFLSFAGAGLSSAVFSCWRVGGVHGCVSWLLFCSLWELSLSSFGLHWVHLSWRLAVSFTSVLELGWVVSLSLSFLHWLWAFEAVLLVLMGSRVDWPWAFLLGFAPSFESFSL